QYRQEPSSKEHPYPAELSATLLQALGQVDTIHDTKWDDINSLICLNKQPFELRSKDVDVIAFPTTAASVSRIILVTPNSAARSKLLNTPIVSACKALAARL